MRAFLFCAFLSCGFLFLTSCAPQAQALSPEKETALIDSLYNVKSEIVRDSMTNTCAVRLTKAFQ